MSYKTMFKEVMKEYEKARNKATERRRYREEEVYHTIPEIREIDERLSSRSMELAKGFINDGMNIAEFLEMVKSENDQLLERKRQLLAENGFAPNYLSEIYECNNCKDTGYVDGKKCHCLKQRLIEKHYMLSSLSHIIKNENFDNFDFRFYSDQPDTYSGVSARKNMHTIYKQCTDFVRNFGNGDNLYFYGNSGLGKTFLCNCIAKDILDKGNTVLYMTASEVFKIAESIRFEKGSDDELYELMDTIYDVDLLIIDDLGTEFATVVTSSELFNICNRRILRRKHTVISSNLGPDELESQYSERIVSRFIGNYKLLKFFGDDIRIKKKYQR